MKVTRYFHMNNDTPYSFGKKPKRNGATVVVCGDTDDPAQVDVRVAFCSRKDKYCRKTGREEALKAKPKIVMLRHLPRELHNIAVESGYGDTWNYAAFDFAVKYFLPKE